MPRIEWGNTMTILLVTSFFRVQLIIVGIRDFICISVITASLREVSADYFLSDSRG